MPIFSLLILLNSCGSAPSLTYIAETVDINQLRVKETEAIISETDIVFFTESGSVWHKKRDCFALAKSDSVIEGSEKDAIEAGKKRLCQRCG